LIVLINPFKSTPSPAGFTGEDDIQRGLWHVISLEASQLSAGTYAYTLIVDGKKIETKKMVIVR